MAEDIEQTPSGLFVARETEDRSEKKPKKREIRVRGIHERAKGIQVVTDVRMETQHQLSPEKRKQRRADNKAMKEIRKKTRGRKRHGRR